MINNLTDFEKKELKTFTDYKKRTDTEIENFIKILIELREQPDKNPQLSKKEDD